MTVNVHDKRYIKSEQRLRGAFLTEMNNRKGLGLRSSEVSRRAGVSKMTFYRHYRCPGLVRIARSIQNDIIKEYAATLKRIARHSQNTTELVRGTFLFMQQHKDVVTTSAKLGQVQLFERMGNKLWPYFRHTTYRHGMRRMKIAYIYELTGIFLYWIQYEKFNQAKIEQYTTYIMEISRNSTRRLSFLADQE